MARSDEPLSAASSVGDWLAHPKGGALLRSMLQEAGQSESVLRPVRLFSLQRLVQLSKGRFPQEVVDSMVAEVNGGVAPDEHDER